MTAHIPGAEHLPIIPLIAAAWDASDVKMTRAWEWKSLSEQEREAIIAFTRVVGAIWRLADK